MARSAFDSVDLSGNEEDGPGRVLSVTVRCREPGNSALSLTDTDLGGGDTMGVLGQSGAILYEVGNEIEATVNCVGRGVDTVALDLDAAGNAATSIGAGGPGIDSGDIQSSAANIPLDSTFSVDIVVDAVPSDPGDGLFGIGGELLYDAAVVEVVAVENTALLHYSGAGAIPFNSADAMPDADGSFRFYSIDTSGTDEAGPGRVYTFSLRCKAQGQSDLSLVDTVTGGVNTLALFGSGASVRYGVLNEMEAVVACGQEIATPSPIPTPSPSPTIGPTVQVIWGDSNCADGMDPFDAYLVLRYDAGLPTNSPGCPGLGTTVGFAGGTTPWGDWDCEGNADPIDALKTLREDAGLPAQQQEPCPDLGTQVSIMAGSLATPTPEVSPTQPGSPTATPSISAALTVGSADASPGQFVTLPVTADVIDLVAYRVDVKYDASLVVVDGCHSSFGICSVDTVAPGMVRINGTNLSRITGEGVVLGSVTFIVGDDEGVADITIDPNTLLLYTPEGEQIDLPVVDGSITITSPTPTPSATPVPTPTPTIQPTTSPFITPSPNPTFPPPTSTPLAPFCDGKPATIVGTNGPDILQGTNQADVIQAGGGSDIINGLGGNDVICAGDGNDVVFGGNGADDIFGGAGGDSLYGDAGHDTINGGASIDFCAGGRERDSVIACEMSDAGGGE
jgi:hypothetical protein